MSPEQALDALAATVDLDREQRASLAEAVTVTRVEAGRPIRRAGRAPRELHLLLSGWAGREKMVESGARQFCLFLLPGDFCDLDALRLDRLTYATIALTACDVAAIDRQALTAVIEASPKVATRMLRLMAVENAAMTEWTINLGRRSALERTANLLSELAARLGRLGLAGDGGFHLPVSQEIIADRLGLTAVHVNRMLQQLRTAGLIRLAMRRVTILDPDRLARTGGFEPAYLHLT